MHGISIMRVAGVLAALFIASFISFPSFPKDVFISNSPSVNRALKGDRLPLATPGVSSRELGLPVPPEPSRARDKAPVGCDSAFSPIAAPALANIFKRCMV